jgi:hypothetical protein
MNGVGRMPFIPHPPPPRMGTGAVKCVLGARGESEAARRFQVDVQSGRGIVPGGFNGAQGMVPSGAGGLLTGLVRCPVRTRISEPVSPPK